MKKRQEIEQAYEIAGVIVDEVLPYSLEYFLGIEHEGDDEFGEEDEDDEDGDDDDDAPVNKKKKKEKSGSKSKSKSKGKDKKEAAKTEQKPECKQQ